jgi:hypothetical protein
MFSYHAAVLVIIIVIIILAFFSYNVFDVKEGFQEKSCNLSKSSLEEIISSVSKIKTIMNDLKDYPWPDKRSFDIMYTIIVTRMEYLINTYGVKLSKNQFLPLLTNDKLLSVFENYSKNNYGLLEEVFAELYKITTIIETNVSTTCPVCDTIYIVQTLERLDYEFTLYYSSTFYNKEITELDENVQKYLMSFEIDMINLTEYVKVAIKKQKVNAKGILDTSLIDATIKDLDDMFSLISTNLQLYKFLNSHMNDIKSFIELKKMVIEDLKKCVVTPVIYDKCNYTGKKVNLIEGRYELNFFLTHYNIANIASIQVPPNYNIIFHMKNGDVVLYNSDIECLTTSFNQEIDVMNVSVARKNV